MNLPIELFPEKTDIERISYLYSYETNNYQNIEFKKIQKFWKTVISNYCLISKSFKIEYHNLLQSFTIYDIEPTSLLACFKLMLQNGEIIKVNDNETDKTVMSFVMNMVNSLLYPPSPEVQFSGEVVFLPLAKKTAEVIVRYVRNLPITERCFFTNSDAAHMDSKLTIKSIINDATATCDDIYLRQFMQGLTESEYIYIMEALVGSGQANMLKQNSVIHIHCQSLASSSEVELARLKLRQSILTIETRLNSCETKITDSLSRAKMCKSKCDKTGALMYLRMKRNTEEVRNRLTDCLSNLSSAIMRLESAMDMVVIRDSYLIATSGLRAARKQSDLTVESIEDAQEAFTEELDIFSDISATLQSTSYVDSNINEDDETLLEELNEIIRNDAYNTEKISALPETSKTLENSKDDIVETDLVKLLAHTSLNPPTHTPTVLNRDGEERKTYEEESTEESKISMIAG